MDLLGRALVERRNALGGTLKLYEVRYNKFIRGLHKFWTGMGGRDLGRNTQ